MAQLPGPGTHELAGSSALARPGAEPAGPVAADQPVEVTVVLRPRPDATGSTASLLGQITGPRVGQARAMSRQELVAVRGADPQDVDRVRQFAEQTGLTVVAEDPSSRRVVLAGSARQMGSAWGVTLTEYTHPEGSFRSHDGPVRLPEELAEAVVAVLGLDTRPIARPRLRRSATTPTQSYLPTQVAQAYGYPPVHDVTPPPGQGWCLGVLELGGGWVAADLQTYFAGLGLVTPEVRTVSVDGATSDPTGTPDGPDAEVMLDLEVAGACAPGALLVMYVAPNTDRGFVDAIAAAVADATNDPAVLSISWGGPEESWTASARAAMEGALTDAALAGVSVTVAAGDHGSSDGVGDGLAHVDYPAASPYVLACGGTRLTARGTQVLAETVWNDLPGGGATGGGVSAVFPVPAWQSAAGVDPVSANPGHGGGRGVPDVAGNADPDTGYQVRVDGTDLVLGGTSAVAPLVGSLLLIAAATAGHRLGLVNPTAYAAGGQDFRDVTVGGNGAYQAGPGWDACTGWGSPRAGELIARATAPAPGSAGAGRGGRGS